jgi:hypothetical protein
MADGVLAGLQAACASPELSAPLVLPASAAWCAVVHAACLAVVDGDGAVWRVAAMGKVMQVRCRPRRRRVPAAGRCSGWHMAPRAFTPPPSPHRSRIDTRPRAHVSLPPSPPPALLRACPSLQRLLVRVGQVLLIHAHAGASAATEEGSAAGQAAAVSVFDQITIVCEQAMERLGEVEAGWQRAVPAPAEPAGALAMQGSLRSLFAQLCAHLCARLEGGRQLEAPDAAVLPAPTDLRTVSDAASAAAAVIAAAAVGHNAGGDADTSVAGPTQARGVGKRTERFLHPSPRLRIVSPPPHAVTCPATRFFHSGIGVPLFFCASQLSSSLLGLQDLACAMVSAVRTADAGASAAVATLRHWHALLKSCAVSGERLVKDHNRIVADQVTALCDGLQRSGVAGSGGAVAGGSALEALPPALAAAAEDLDLRLGRALGPLLPLPHADIIAR